MFDNQPEADNNHNDSTSMVNKKSLTYLALGDSYTIGEAVAENERWPVILVNSLNETEISIDKPDIIAQTGWTTDELIKAIEQEETGQNYDLVSLLIGVNNQYRDYPFEQFKEEFELLLKKAVSFAGGNSNKVIVLSIPDYSVTPFADNSDKQKISEEIDAYNDYKKQVCEEYKVTFFNITEISREAKSNASLIADDGLHPSGKMYQLWVEEVIDDVVNMF